MKIEHCNGRLQSWVNEQPLIQTLTELEVQLNDKVVNRMRFFIRPVSWIHDVVNRYKDCLSEPVLVKLAIKSRRLVRVDAQFGVTVWTEPMVEAEYPPWEKIPAGHINSTASVSVKEWLELNNPPNDNTPVWANPHMRERESLEGLRKCTPNMTRLHDLIDKIIETKGRTSEKPEYPLFWTLGRNGLPAGRVAPTLHVPDVPPNARGRLVKVASDNKLWICFILDRRADGSVLLQTLNAGPNYQEHWISQLKAEDKGNTSSPHYWDEVDLTEATTLVRFDGTPIPAKKRKTAK